MYIYVLYVSCFAFSWWTDVGICREVFPRAAQRDMMHHHHNCTGTIYHLPITRYNLILSNKKMHLRNPKNLTHRKQGILSDKKMRFRNPQNLMRGKQRDSLK